MGAACCTPAPTQPRTPAAWSAGGVRALCPAGGGVPTASRGAAVCLQGTGHPGRLQAQPFVTEGLISEELQQKVPNEVAAVVFNPAVL